MIKFESDLIAARWDSEPYLVFFPPIQKIYIFRYLLVVCYY